MKQGGESYRQIFLLGVLLEIFLIAMLGLGNLGEEVLFFLPLYFLAFLVYLGALRFTLTPTGGADQAPVAVTLILGFALLFRVTLFFSEPGLSDDIYRYVWDGKILNQGINPYQYAPNAQALAPLRDALYEQINHKDIGTPYGPVTIMVFALAQRIANSIYLMKVPFILFDGLSIVLLLRMLRVSGLPAGNVLIYAWNPLVLVEVAGSGHNDPFAIFFLLGALYFLLQKHSWRAAVGIVLALSSKYLAVLFLPVIWKKMKAGAWILLALGLVLIFAPFYRYLENHLQSIMTVGSNWRFNDSLFAVFQALTGSLFLSKAISAVAFVLLAVYLYIRNGPILKSAMVLIGGALLLTTTVQPWYLLWIVPFLCFYPNRAWLLLTGLIVLSYHVLIRYRAEGIWLENIWIKTAIYVPFYALLLTDAWRTTRFRGARAKWFPYLEDKHHE